MTGEVPPEIAFVTHAIQPDPPVENLETRAERDLDWERVYREAVGRHKVGPMLYRTLRDTGVYDAVPGDTADRLEQVARQYTTRNLALVNSLFEILDRFDEADVAALPYKGPVLSERVYGEFSVRQSLDLDVLVRPADLPEADAVLREGGFEPERDLTGNQWRLLLENGRHQTLRRDGLEVELHARVSAAPDDPFEVDELLDRARRTTIQGRQVPTIDLADEVLLLCVHGTRHRWSQLKWVADIAYLLSDRRLDWPAVLQRARERGCLRRVLAGCELAATVLDVDPPAAVRSTDARGLEEVLAATYPTCLLDTEERTLETIGYQWAARDDAVDRTRYLLWKFLQPTAEDSRAIDLPPGLYPLYYLVRLLRAVGLGGKAARRRLETRYDSE